MKLEGKFTFNLCLKLVSGASVGSGENSNTDADIICDSDGTPIIPISSFFGVLSQLSKKHIGQLGLDSKILNEFWGFTDNNDSGSQSWIYSNDLKAKNDILIEVRNGNKHDLATGVTENKLKFDFELVPLETIFQWEGEVDVPIGKKGEISKIITCFFSLINSGHVSVGKKTKRGLGKLGLSDESISIQYFDFNTADGILNWMIRGEGSIEKIILEEIPTLNYFEIDAYFNIKTSILSRMEAQSVSEPDTRMMQSGGKNMIAGTSLAGPISGNIKRIIRTFQIKEKANEIENRIFGNVDKKTKEAAASNFYIGEFPIEGGVNAVQTRVPIDRFTGGVMEGMFADALALFGRPLEQNSSDEKSNWITIRIKMGIEKADPSAAGALLLALQNLWIGALPIGGETSIGRGSLEGIKASISNGVNKIELEQEGFLNKEENDLEHWHNLVKSFKDECTGIQIMEVNNA